MRKKDAETLAEILAFIAEKPRTREELERTFVKP
jgi:hypothetical protein